MCYSCLFVLLFLRRLASNYHQMIDNYKVISDNLSFCKACFLTFSVNEIVQEKTFRLFILPSDCEIWLVGKISLVIMVCFKSILYVCKIGGFE